MNYQNFSPARLSNLFLLSTIFLILLSCNKKPDQRLENYRLIWRTDSNFVQLQQFRPDTINGRPCDLGCKLFQISSPIPGNPVLTVTENKKGVSLASKDTVVPANKMTYAMGEIPGSFIGSPYYHFGDPVHTLENNIGFTTYNHVEIGHITAGIVKVRVNNSISMTVLAQHLSQLEISGDEKGPAYPLNLTFSFDQDASQGLVEIKHKVIRVFNIGQHIRHLKISDCVVDKMDNDIFGGFPPDTLELQDVKFTTPVHKLNLLGLTGSATKKHVTLICEGIDISNVYFDYSYYDFSLPAELVKDARKNAVYSYNKKFFKDLIKNQGLDNNEGGKVKAQIDSAHYEDSFHMLGFLENPVKSWWNSYGFDKESVIWSVLELFFGIVFINLFVFSRMIAAYNYTEIDSAYQEIQTGYNKRTKPLKTFFICTIYSGFIFFGLKLDIEKLKLANRGIAFWIILQYVGGIIALAYIANLVLGK